MMYYVSMLEKYKLEPLILLNPLVFHVLSGFHQVTITINTQDKPFQVHIYKPIFIWFLTYY